ncbi:mannan endo-1,6-alpha-mannosidase [Schizosaccharomyces japonicus yFS275]|uniref:Mannan endo-1,6-alpha-mannosidase n=1 Tax=Schizosaccharomyces japonicus (strain yFS275 / FY16936) TaxID=402676 RepID=B6K7X7_SCHJY|nr:mannan endo-1,6-alpha-mannosidase [Schizosaccharomyces japonicus yFS275]EEB09631.1 mannan endo-1,6-alpha-mannosidase [Schizosaccharomyces japonicus yFS275]
MKITTVLLGFLTCIRLSFAFSLDVTDENSILDGLNIVKSGLMNYYDSSTTVFLTVYWWMTGAGMNALLNNYYLTGNSTYNDLVTKVLLSNTGDENDFAPSSQTLDLGNDDQAFWALTAMSAAELNFTESSSQSSSWLEMAQAVFNEQVARWDTTLCDGGLRWQIYPFNNGYTYKNSITNGLLFQLAARIARFTANDTCAEFAEKVWDWTTTVGFLNESTFTVYDGATTADNCSTLTETQWTYNVGVFLGGAAYLYNYTNGSTVWQQRLDGLITKASNHFFSGGVIYDPQCETSNSCNTDQPSFKGYLARFMMYAMQLAPYTYDTIMPLMKTSATAAALACSGGSDAVTCGTRWYWNNGTWDSNYGVGQQLSALEVIQSLLVDKMQVPLTQSTGGTSASNPNAGSASASSTVVISPATTKDKHWSRFFTALLVFLLLSCSIWLFL